MKVRARPCPSIVVPPSAPGNSPTLQPANPPALSHRPYQEPVYRDNTTGILILHWSRQIGKSFTLANWAVTRLLSQLEQHRSWLITVLSNSRDNGAEFCRKAADGCRIAAESWMATDESPDLTYQNMRLEIRITRHIGAAEHTSRIKVLAASRDEAGHAGHFWALALALRAAAEETAPGQICVFGHTRCGRVVAERRRREVLG